MIQVNVRNPRSDETHGYVNFGTLSSSFMIEGPVTANTAMAVGMKRGFLDFYMRMAKEEFEDDLAFTTYPYYYDGNILLTHTLSDSSRLRMITIGSHDRTRLALEDEPDSYRFSSRVSEGEQFVHSIFEWEYENGDIANRFSPMIGVSKHFIDFGPRAFFYFRNRIVSLSEKFSYDLDRTHKIQAGGRLVFYHVSINSSFFAPPKEGEVAYNPYATEINDDQEISVTVPAFYIVDTLTLDDCIITPGVQTLYDPQNDHAYVDPRLLMRYSINETVLKSAVGLYSKMPEEDECFEPWGTQGLFPEHSLHYIAGVEYYLSDHIMLDVQGYYKRFYDLVVRTDSKDPTHYTNEGKGFAYGAEVLLRHEMTRNWFGWLSYSYTRSRRKDGPNAAERFFDMDITHNLITVLSYKPNEKWQFGLKFQFASGQAYTDLLYTETLYDVENDEYTPLYNGPVNNDRIPDRHQLDIRIDRYWKFDNVILSTYLDIQNVYLNKQPLTVTYNEDYTDKEYFRSLPILVFLGAKIDF